jgi:hypothetical protein
MKDGTVVAEYGSALVRTKVVAGAQDDRFTWIRTGGAARPEPLQQPPRALMAALTALDPGRVTGRGPGVRCVLPHAYDSEGGLRYTLPGRRSLAELLLSVDSSRAPDGISSTQDELYGFGRLLRALHSAPPPAPGEADAYALPGAWRRLCSWTASPAPGRPAQLHRALRELLGSARWRRIEGWSDELPQAVPRTLVHGAPGLGLLVPAEVPHIPHGLITGEDVGVAPWQWDVGWVLAELRELRFFSARLHRPETDGPPPERWKELLPENPEARLDHFTLLDGPGLDRALLLVVRSRHAVSEITVHDLETGTQLETVPTPGLGTVGEIRGAGHEAWFTYTDPFTPVTVFRWDATDRTTTVWATPPGHRPEPAHRTAGTMRQITCTSADGTPVRITVLAPHDETHGRPRRPRPAILYGYGGFGLSYTPVYNPEVVAWVEAGGVYAVAHVRGGGEEGADWHRSGTRARKQKSVDDFHAAAEALCRQRWTTPSRLVISGESNGGLLVGAVLTQHPGLCRAVVCAAPVLDMVRYERSGLGASWTAEYGSATVPEELSWLLGYSPYHHVSDGTDYPAVLLTVSEGDAVVDPFHARKMCAALQHAVGSSPAEDGRGLTLLRVESDVGHGARAMTRIIELTVDQLSFAAWHSGLALPGGSTGGESRVL